VKQVEDGYVRFVALSSSFYVPNFVRFDAGVLKLQQMIKWDVFWDTVYIGLLGCTMQDQGSCDGHTSTDALRFI